MPRRGSRKSILEKKPKLEFVKSPVQGPECPVSPVLGALHPLTAKAIAVDDSDQTWISPNFQALARQNLTTSRLKLLHGKRTVTRQRHPSSGKENISFKKTALGRLKPLKFLKDVDQNDTEFLDSLTPPPENSLSDDVDLCPTADVKTPEFKRYSNSFVERNSRVIDSCVEACENVAKHEVCQAPNLINSPLRILNFSCDEDKNSDVALSQVRRSSRLQEKYLEALKLLHTPPHKGKRDSKVLVVDTPESEYGLSLRRRQLACLRGKVSSNPS